MVEDEGIVGGAAGQEKRSQFSRAQPPRFEFWHSKRMLKHLTGTENELIFRKLMRREIPSSNAVFDVIFTLWTDIQFPK